MERKVHWIDSIGQELWDEVHSDVEVGRQEIKGEVPLGTVSLLPEEQLTRFLESTPEQLEQIEQQVGPEEFQEYMNSMQNLMDKKLGPLAKLFKVFNAQG